jgi:hypothetical protein
MSPLERIWTLTGLKPEESQTATSAIARPWRLQISQVILRKEVKLKAPLREEGREREPERIGKWKRD